MQLFILKAENIKEIEEISNTLSENKFKQIQQEDNYILMKKRRYGNILIHIICLIIALQFIGIVIFINVIYFSYSYIWASPNVLITTETLDKDGNKLEFNEMDEILNKANSIL